MAHDRQREASAIHSAHAGKVSYKLRQEYLGGQLHRLTEYMSDFCVHLQEDPNP